MESPVNGQQRGSIRIGHVVDIIRKEDQRSGKKTRGIVQEILTNSLSHPHGIKVRLKGGHVGRVTEIISALSSGEKDNGSCHPTITDSFNITKSLK
jgi:uncharacterized repeat protein (TIGR03833 family)